MELYLSITLFAAAFFALGYVYGQYREMVRLSKLEKEGGDEL